MGSDWHSYSIYCVEQEDQKENESSAETVVMWLGVVRWRASDRMSSKYSQQGE